MKQFLSNLLRYNIWADKAILETIESNQDRVNSRIVVLVSHLLNAQIFWYSRVLKKEIKIKVWDVYEIGQLREIMNENVDHISFILKNFKLDDMVEYKNATGKEFQNSILDILFHVFNHGNYHRGQINAELRELDIDPPAIDYIFYCRD